MIQAQFLRICMDSGRIALGHFKLYVAKLSSKLLKLVLLALSLHKSFSQPNFLLIWCGGMQWLGLYVQAPYGEWEGTACFT